MTKALLEPSDPTGQAASGGMVYDRTSAVSFDIWQTELAFDHLNGQPRNTTARNSGDARFWYDNYVSTWNSSDAATRYAIDQQHGFFGGNLIDNTPVANTAQAATAPAQTAPPPPAPAASTNPPTNEEISPEPDNTTGSSIESVDHTPVSAEVIQQEVEEDTKPIVEADTAEGMSDDNESTDYTVRSQDQETNNDDDSLLTVRDVTPQDEVVDPITGVRYASPEAARRAGISNWVYATNYGG